VYVSLELLNLPPTHTRATPLNITPQGEIRDIHEFYDAFERELSDTENGNIWYTEYLKTKNIAVGVYSSGAPPPVRLCSLIMLHYEQTQQLSQRRLNLMLEKLVVFLLLLPQSTLYLPNQLCPLHSCSV
jgi:hypothetical protein